MARFISILILLTIPCFTFTDSTPLLYYINLEKLHEASAPAAVDMVMTGEIATGKKLIRRGLLFTIKNRNARQIEIAGSFSWWKTIPMTRSRNGVWYYFLQQSESGSVDYKYNVDGFWINDPANIAKIDDSAGSFISRAETLAHENIRFASYKIHKKNTVEFRTYRPEASIITVVGDFNNWNPENDLLKKDTAGLWRITKRLPAGTFRYSFIIDGRWESDLYNPETASDPAGRRCSLIKVKK